MIFRLFVTGNVHTFLFLPIFVFWLFLSCWCLCFLYCFWWLKSAFLCPFSCSLWIVQLTNFITIAKSDRLARISWSVFTTNSKRTLCFSFFRTESVLSIYICVLRFTILGTFLNSSPSSSSRVESYSLFAMICCIRLLSDWSFRLYHRITYLFYLLHPLYFHLNIVLMALFCAAIRRDFLFLLKGPSLSYVQVFSCEISLVYFWIQKIII